MRENERMTKYETDFHQWAFEQAQRLRSGEPVDVENVAEELETLARSEERELTNRLAVLLQHMLKCEHQPERRTAICDGHDQRTTTANRPPPRRKPEPQTKAARVRARRLCHRGHLRQRWDRNARRGFSC